MAFGRHWEWRGFGGPGEAVYARIRSLPSWFPEPQAVTDRYLWVPGCAINVKLRFRDLKIKRLLGKGEKGADEWLEDEAENYPFPLESAVVERLARALRIRLSDPLPRGVEGGGELIDILRRDAPDLRVIAVEKLRWQHRVPEAEDAIVEYAEIGSPEELVSVSVEELDGERLVRIMKRLGLPGPLRAMSYLEALDVWGRGKSLLE